MVVMLLLISSSCSGGDVVPYVKRQDDITGSEIAVKSECVLVSLAYLTTIRA
jgi:hypothetical protein